MADEQRNSRRTWLALLGIGVFIAVAIFIGIALLIMRTSSPLNESPVEVPVNVGGQTVIIEPDPAMSFQLVGEQSSGVSSSSATGGRGPDTSGNQAPGAAAPVQPVVTLPPPSPTPPPAVVLIDYRVAPGDTLYRLAQVYNTSIELMASHNIAASSLIAGSTILLPIANAEFCPGGRAHVVRDQQTVSEIARIFGTTSQAIGAANNLDANYSVWTSQVICVP